VNADVIARWYLDAFDKCRSGSWSLLTRWGTHLLGSPLSTASKHTLHDTNSPTPRAESEALPILRRSYEPRSHAKRYRERKSPRGATAPCLLPRGGLHHRAVIRPSLSRQSKMMLEAHRSRSRLRGLFCTTTSAPRRALVGLNPAPRRHRRLRHRRRNRRQVGSSRQGYAPQGRR